MEKAMSGLVRFGVSLEKGLACKLDTLLKEKGYSNRSEFLRDLIRNELVKEEWLGKGDVVGAITLVYDHHKRELINSLTDVQHDFHELIVSGQHIHLDQRNCLEIIAVKGSPKRIDELANKLKAAKGVKHGALSMTTTGKNLV
jgi:CopG family nickel-responsive transcriptional regulator